jgi:hypothetical protein
MTIHQFLHEDNKALGSLFLRLQQLKKWNQALRESLDTDAMVADHCQIVNLTDNALIIIADSPLWLTRIRFFIPTLLPKLRAYPCLENIKAMCCKVHPSYTPHKKHQPRAPQKLSSTAKAKINDIADTITDPKLSAALKKLTQES